MTQIEMNVLSLAEIALKKINDIELRDLFAMQALNGMLIGEDVAQTKYDFIAKKSYEVADAMLEARKKK